MATAQQKLSTYKTINVLYAVHWQTQRPTFWSIFIEDTIGNLGSNLWNMTTQINQRNELWKTRNEER